MQLVWFQPLNDVGPGMGLQILGGDFLLSTKDQSDSDMSPCISLLVSGDLPAHPSFQILYGFPVPAPSFLFYPKNIS